VICRQTDANAVGVDHSLNDDAALIQGRVTRIGDASAQQSDASPIRHTPLELRRPKIRHRTSGLGNLESGHGRAEEPRQMVRIQMKIGGSSRQRQHDQNTYTCQAVHGFALMDGLTDILVKYWSELALCQKRSGRRREEKALPARRPPHDGSRPFTASSCSLSRLTGGTPSPLASSR
jgi:hypothetical protein